jgi:hypothetical protein
MSVVPQARQARAFRWPGRFAAANHPDLVFWLRFFVLNGLLFLPAYLVNRETSSFLPGLDAAGQSARSIARQLLLWRGNLDVFRLSLEIAVLAALWVHVRWLWRGSRPRLYRALFTVVYILALSYAIYESIFLSLYQVDPVFYAQYRMAVDGARFVVEHLYWPWTVYASGAALLVVITAAVLRLTHGLIGGSPPERLSRWTRLAVALLALWSLLATLAVGLPLASPKSAVNSLAVKLEQNLSESVALRDKIAAFDSQAPQRVYDYRRYNLLRKPDIYLIFVESYGSVLYKRNDWRAAYEQLLEELEQTLAGGGWHLSTALSESPTWGGGSWMAYTSALFGMRIDSHPEYLSLFDQYQDAAYPDLGRYLQSQGYHSLRVTPLATELRESEWLRYMRFYGVDNWLQYSDLDYQGPRYGWGPAPPDQYVLWYTETEVAEKLDQPLFLFYLTQNSHYPWVPQPQLVEDWQTLNRPSEDVKAPLPDQIPQSAKRRNYLSAIEYQLRFLTDFILKNDRDDAVYVLIGDHQPQQVSRREDGFETPVHIISRNARFVEFFRDYGFVEGLTLEDIAPALRHEGFYSLFVRGLLASYGQGGKVLPAYLTDGIVVDLPDVANE